MITALALVLGNSSFSFGLVKGSMQRGSSTSAGQKLEKVFRIPAEKKLDLQLQTGASINIIGWDRDIVSLKVTVGGPDWQDCRFEANETSSAIQIISRYQGNRDSYSTSLHFDILVPENFHIDIESAGGDVRINNVRGNLRGKTKGGLVELKNVGGELQLTTMGGNVNLTNSDVNGEVQTMGGQVLIQNVTGDIHGSSMGGEVKYINVVNRSGNIIR